MSSALKRTHGHSSFSANFLESKSQRVRAIISLKNLRHNAKILFEKSGKLPLTVMVKANGYGHGIEAIAHELSKLKIVQAIGVATLEEGMQVRKIISKKVPIHVYSGAVFTGKKSRCEVFDICKRHSLTPVITDFSSLKSFVTRQSLIPFQIKFNTGMNRLGVEFADREKVTQLLEKKSELKKYVRGLLTHFAQAEQPESNLTRTQWRRFLILHHEFNRVGSFQWHIANSATIWNSSSFELTRYTHAVRPGISLYGIPPWKGAPLAGLRPVMHWQARVLSIHDLLPGERAGYGGTFVNRSRRSIRVATLGVGYGDGLHRVLSNHLLNLKMEILGRVSMDLTIVKAEARWKIGDWVSISGFPGCDLWSLSEKALTMPYEWLTSVSPRVERVYVD